MPRGNGRDRPGTLEEMQHLYTSPPEGGRSSRRASRGSSQRRSTSFLEDDLASPSTGMFYSLEEFDIGELVLARNINRLEPWWPGVVVDPLKEAPEGVRRQSQANRLCIMFYGPSASQHRTRDFSWIQEGEILPLSEYLDDIKKQCEGRATRGEPFAEAVEEVLLVDRGLADPVAGATADDFNERAYPRDGQGSRPACISCNAALSKWELANSRSLNRRCSDCEELHRKGNYCPVCDRTWTAADKDMVGCDTCDFWVHSSCDRMAAKVLASGEDMDYFCPQCRKAKNADNRLMALRQAEAAVQAAQPRQPRTAYHLFSAEIHKQYNVDVEKMGYHDMARVVGDTWRTLTLEEREPYEMVAAQEMQRYAREKRAYEDLQRKYAELRYAAEQDGILAKNLLSSGQLVRELSSGHKRPKPEQDYRPPPPKKQAKSHAYSHAQHSPPAAPRSQPALAMPGGGGGSGPAQRVPVFCNGIYGTLILGRQRVYCQCEECMQRPETDREFSCTQFEQHCGAGSAKKWKASLRIPAGAVPEVPPGGASMPVGKWMDMKGIDVKPTGGRSVPVPPSGSARQLQLQQQLAHTRAATPPLPTARPLKKEKEEKELGPPPAFEPWLDMSKGTFKPIQVRWAGDRCSVCDSDVDFDFDQLVSCDMCGITVHQSCYGVPELPGEDDLWLCRACELKEEGGKAPQCCLCPVSGGALKRTTDDGLWCHAACMQWIPEVTVEDITRMEPVSHIKSIQKERWDLLCCVCKQRVGAKIQCTSCYTAYHPLCGRIAGLHMEMVDGEGGPEGPVRLISYCPRHCTPKPQLSGVTLLGKENEAKAKALGQGDGNGLWNGQVFPPPALVPVPACPSGSSRMEPLQSQGWTRVSHGSGMGFSSAAGFWIPKKQLQIVQLPKPKPKARKKTSNAYLLGKARSRPSGGRLRGAAKASKEGRDVRAEGKGRGSLSPREPLAPVELLPLPAGVPEEVAVNCNGRTGTMIIRLQRVLYQGQEMSASKFEAICGKGDAKKWKSSLWLEDEHGEPIMMMNDWLTEQKLDRKVLANLTANMASHRDYADYVVNEVSAVVDDLLDAAAGDHEPQSAQEVALTLAQAPLVEGIAGEAVSDMKIGEDGSEAAPRASSDGAALTADANGHASAADSQAGQAGLSGGEVKADVMEGSGNAEQHLASCEGSEQGDGETGMEDGMSAFEDAESGDEAEEGDSPGQITAEPSEAGEQDDGALLDADIEVDLDDDADTSKQPDGSVPSAADGASANANDAEAGTRVPTQAETEEAVQASTGRLRQGAPARPSAMPTENGPPGPSASPAKAAGKSAAVGPEACLGEHCEVFFPNDNEWYKAFVRGYDRATKLFNFWYYVDEESEWIDLKEEDRVGRVRWEDKAMSTHIRHEAKAKGAPPPFEPDALRGAPAPKGQDALGWRVGIWWRDDAAYYYGMVEEFDSESGRHRVHYDDGENERLLLSAEHVKWQKPPGSKTRPPSPPPPLTVKEEPAARPEEPPKKAVEPRDVPDTLRVVCNAMCGTFHVSRSVVMLESGQTVSPTEFERLAGKSASKKWKASIRVDKGHGMPGITVGDWLVDRGLDAPKAPRPKADSSLSAMRQRQGIAMRTTSNIARSSSAAAGKQGHRESCMCVICKQARRTGRPWAGMTGEGAPPPWVAPEHLLPPTRKGDTPVEPRFGKRAFVRSTAQLVRGPANCPPWAVPKSSVLAPEEFEAANTDGSEEGRAASARNSPTPVQGDHDDKALVLVEGKSLVERKGLTLKERLEVCQATERQRLTFGKSGIHGWGLIARQEMKQDSMIIEYRGELLRRSMADAREKRYRATQMDCYLFNVNDDIVIDATMKGTIGRFTNHCCAPSMYTKVLEIDGQPHLVFFARQDIRIGQELTYDYRFKEEEGDNKLVCACGAPNCRGFMN